MCTQSLPMYDHKCEVMSLHWNNSFCKAISHVTLGVMSVCVCVFSNLKGDCRQRESVSLNFVLVYVCVSSLMLRVMNSPAPQDT